MANYIIILYNFASFSKKLLKHCSRTAKTKYLPQLFGQNLAPASWSST